MCVWTSLFSLHCSENRKVGEQRTREVENSVGEDGCPEGNVVSSERAEAREGDWNEDNAVCDLLMYPEQ